MAQVNMRIDSDIWEELRKHKQATGVPIAVAVRQAVREWLDKKETKK